MENWNQKHPWTHWAIVIYCFGVAAFSILTWVLEWYPSGWYSVGFFTIFLLLYWFDGVLRADRDTKYRNYRLRSEVQREVRVEFDRRESKKAGKPARKNRVIDTEAEEAPLLKMVQPTDPRRKHS